ncbi:MAG TPA: trypsin-like serine protease, partial [Polyangiaceae bacterium]
MTRLRTLAAAFAFTLAGCGDADWTSESIDTDDAAITGGTLVTAAQHVAPHTSVVKLQTLIGSCTALKVGSNAFWTAGHCIPLNPIGTEIKLTNLRSGDLVTPQYTTTIASAAVHPSRKNYEYAFGVGGPYPRHYDVARFTLTGTTPDIPSYATTDSEWIAGNQDVSFTAYGCDREDSSHSGRKQRATIHLATLGELASGSTDYYAHNFISLDASPQACPGDSGAPAFKDFGGTWKVVGTVVHGDFGYTGVARYGNVRNWLAAPAVNVFAIGFRGFLFNQYTGRCISGAAGSIPESYCDGRDQDFDFQSWR